MKMPSGTRVPNQGGRSLHCPGPVVLEHKNMKFLITDRPTDATLPRYIEVKMFPFNSFLVQNIDNEQPVSSFF